MKIKLQIREPSTGKKCKNALGYDPRIISLVMSNSRRRISSHKPCMLSNMLECRVTRKNRLHTWNFLIYVSSLLYQVTGLMGEQVRIFIAVISHTMYTVKNLRKIGLHDKNTSRHLCFNYILKI